MRDGVDAGVVARMMESLRLEPTGKRLARIEQQLKGIAERMGKGNVSVSLEPNDLRFNSEHFAPFWSAFIHVLRNAADHGIEDREQRLKSGKPEQSLIRVATAMDGDRFVVTVEDDGPGVDWERLRRKAGELGVAPGAFDEPVKLICLPGVSSKDTVTELSGRGMGDGDRGGGLRGPGGDDRTEIAAGDWHPHRIFIPQGPGSLRRPRGNPAVGHGSGGRVSFARKVKE